MLNDKVANSSTDVYKKYKKQSQIAQIWERFQKNKLAMAGLFVFVAMLLISFSSSIFLDYGDDVINQNIMARFQGPSKEHLLGTDNYGRDILARVIWGGRISLTVGVVTVLLSLTVGSIIGAISAFYGGKVDTVCMRAMDILLAIPGTLLSISIVAALGGSIFNLLLALSIEQVPKMARTVRSSILTLKDSEFIEAARACGAGDIRIIINELLPNCLAPIIVNATLSVSRTILSIAGLSFIGLGIAPPEPEWGSMLSEAKDYFRDYPYLITAPGIAIIVSVMSLTLVGDGLRDAMDPRLKQ